MAELLVILQQWFLWAVDVFLHLDTHLNEWAAMMGPWLYVLLFVIIFCETGLVVTPFLPGDSLLFAIGALAALDGSPIRLPVILILLPFAAFAGDICNYSLGKRVGPRIFNQEKSLLFNRRHLLRAQEFYERHGRKAIILARFMPIVRTFAPFVAGIGGMRFRHFVSFSIFGALLWMWSFALVGFYFGNQPFVKERFHYVVVAIVLISMVPPALHVARAYLRREPAV